MAAVSRQRGRLPDGWLLTRFFDAYGPGLYYKWGHGWKETRDRTIPHRLFLLLADAANTTEALDELSLSHAVTAGIGLAIDGKNNKIKAHHREMVRRAYPLTDDSGEDTE